MNLTQILFGEDQPGPHINLLDAPLSAVQQILDFVGSILLSVCLSFALACGFCGLSVVFSIVARLLWDVRQRHVYAKVIAAHAVIAWFSAVFLLVGSFAATVMARMGTAGINKAGEVVGISAHAGEKMIAISWAAFGIMSTKFLFWCFLYFFQSRYYSLCSYAMIRSNLII